ncbi:MAG: DUF6326 family protein [Flammeovirgaceae bacterium]
MKAALLEEAKVNIRVKLVAIWAAVMFFYIYGDYFALYIPGQAEKLVSGQTLLDGPLKVFAASVLMSLPSAVIVLTVLARAAVARWLNIIFGVIFTGIMLLIAITSIPVTAEVAAYVFYALVESVLTSYIALLAWRWPKSTT